MLINPDYYWYKEVEKRDKKYLSLFDKYQELLHDYKKLKEKKQCQN